MNMSRFIKIVITVLVLTFIFLAFPHPASAQETSDILVSKTDIEDYPKVNIYLNFSEGSEVGLLDLREENFSVFENNEEINLTSVERIASIPEPIGVVLVMDTSGSMKGEPIEDAGNAALLFMDEMRAIDEFAVVGFADSITIYSSFTSNRGNLKDSISQIVAEGETSLFDGIIIALDQFKKEEKIKHKYLIVLSDGTDTVSKLTAQDVIDKAKEEDATIYSIALMSYDFNPIDIGNISRSTNGELLIAADSKELKELYKIISRKIRNQYKISYTSLWPNTDSIDVRIVVEKSELTSSIRTDYINPFYSPAPTKIVKENRPSYLALFDIWWAKIIIYATIFIGVVLFFYIFILLILPRRQLLKERTEFYGYKPARRNLEAEIREKKGKVGFFDRLVIFVSRFASKRGFTGLFELRLQRAGMSIRSSEFITLHIISIIIGSLIVYFLTGNYLLTFLVFIIITLIPFLLLNIRTAQRLRRFHEQLPDTLQLISGSLKAGYSFNQAISMVVEETKPPISDEFKRVLSEIRMGLSDREALENMSVRINSEHFNWVVMAVNVQREVGGNLAEVMEIISNTIRERDKVLNQIKALTAEGKLSAYILIALPILLGIYLSFINREYVSLLVTTKIGLVMIGIAVILMIAGISWILRIIRVEY
jgi:tight adherence protein B